MSPKSEYCTYNNKFKLFEDCLTTNVDTNKVLYL